MTDHTDAENDRHEQVLPESVPTLQLRLPPATGEPDQSDNPAPPARPYRFTDVDGTPLLLLCRVEQIAVEAQGGALQARLHQRGQVVGWDTTWLHVCFDQKRTFVLIRPHLVCVLDPWGSQ